MVSSEGTRRVDRLKVLMEDVLLPCNFFFFFGSGKTLIILNLHLKKNFIGV